MAILASDSGGSEYEQTPQGEHSAICYKIVDAGTQLTDFKGEISKKHKLYIFWELPECLLEDGRPMSEFKEYTLSLGERSNLRRDLQMWRNRPFSEKELAGFDLTAILGVSCKISVGLTSGGRSKVTGVFSADGGAKKVPTINEQVVFDLEDYLKEFTGESNEQSKKMCDVFEELPQFIRWGIAGCDEPGKEKIEPCFEMQAALAKGSDKPASVAAADVEEAEFEDDIPF